MAVYYGQDKINPGYFGSNSIKKIYYGSNRVYLKPVNYTFAVRFPSGLFKIRESSAYPSTIVYELPSSIPSQTVNVAPYLESGNMCYIYNGTNTAISIELNGTVIGTAQAFGGYVDLNISSNANFFFATPTNTLRITTS